jgi:hypothetical protein
MGRVISPNLRRFYMNIREDVFMNVMDEYIDETFNGFSFNAVNVLNKIGAKLVFRNFVKKFSNLISDNGMINIESIENIILPEIQKLGVIEIPAIGTKYTFNENDFIKLFAKMKGKANE